MSKAILELTKRHAKLTHVNIREEKHGEDSVTAIDIKLNEIMLKADELNSLLAEKHAHAALFNQAKAAKRLNTGSISAPAFAFTEKFVDCSASLYLGLGANVGFELEDVTVAKLSLQPLSGGDTALTLTLQHELEDSDVLGDLADQLGRECSVEIVFGKVDEAEKRQGKLPLNSDDKPLNRHGEGEAPATRRRRTNYQPRENDDERSQHTRRCDRPRPGDGRAGNSAQGSNSAARHAGGHRGEHHERALLHGASRHVGCNAARLLRGQLRVMHDVPTSCRPDGVDGDPTRVGTNLLSFSEAKEMLGKCILSTAPKTLDLLTFCVLVLRNGYTVHGVSACASPENFNAELGKKIARTNAVNAIWPLMGYALKQRLLEQTQQPPEPPTTFERGQEC